MHIVEYADAYSYACGIAPHKHKHITYAAMWPYFKTMIKTMFFGSENDGNDNSVNPVDLIVIFLWSHSTSQLEFSIKSYDCLKLRVSNFSFYLFCLSSLFLISFFFLFYVSLSSLFLYMKIDEHGVGDPWGFYF
jgi:hypothetical protein